MDTTNEPFPRGPGRVLRLTVEFHDGVWSVRARRVVERMTVPASQAVPDPGRARRTSGLWFEVVDPRGHVLYRSILAEPVMAVEVHHRDGSMARVPAPHGTWRTDLRIPLLPEGTAVRLFHQPTPTREGTPSPAPEKDRGPAPVLDLDLAELTED